jgi:hypothetical protein
MGLHSVLLLFNASSIDLSQWTSPSSTGLLGSFHETIKKIAMNSEIISEN